MSPRSKQLMDQESADGKDGGRLHRNCAELNEILIGSKQHQQTQRQLQSHHKKQVRRRYHATRSHQGRVLNMAEARREIVAALKIHRASMRETEKQNKQQQFPLQHEVSSTSALTEVSHKEIRSRRSTGMYLPNAVINISSSFEGNSCQTISHPQRFSWASYTTKDAGKLSGDFKITSLNQQPLGLDLNLHNSGSMGNSNCNKISSSMYLSSSSSSVSFSSASSSSMRSSYASTTLSSPKAPSCSIEQIACETSKGHVVQTLHPAMDDEKMAEIRLIGEQHDMEWNDKLNMATLAWWYKFFKSAEIGSFLPGENIVGGREEGHDFLSEPTTIPSWACDQQQFNNYIPEIGCSLQDGGVTQCLDTGDNKETNDGWLP